MPPEIQEVALKTAAVINHKNPELTKSPALGWSAEDDPEYKYPDTEFYPQGTIKANYSEFFIQLLDFADRLGKRDPNIRRASFYLARMVIIHELTHALQYHKKPVRDLNMVQGSCPEGLCDVALLEETKLKIVYEKEAFESETPFRPNMPWAYQQLTDAVERHMKESSQDFQSGGRYHLLSPEKSADMVTRYRKKAKLAASGQSEFAASATVYEGQWVPAKNVWLLTQINKWGNPDLCSRVQKIVAETEPFFNAGGMTDFLRKITPYINDVEKRYRLELALFENLAQKQGYTCLPIKK